MRSEAALEADPALRMVASGAEFEAVLDPRRDALEDRDLVAEAEGVVEGL